MKRAVAFLLVIVHAAAAAPEAYKWFDKNGQVHFGDRPPAHAESEAIELPDQVPVDPVTEERSAESRETQDRDFDAQQLRAFERRVADTERESDRRKERASSKRQAECRQAQASLQSAKSQHRAYANNPDWRKFAKVAQATVDKAEATAKSACRGVR